MSRLTNRNKPLKFKFNELEASEGSKTMNSVLASLRCKKSKYLSQKDRPGEFVILHIVFPVAFCSNNENHSTAQHLETQRSVLFWIESFSQFRKLEFNDIS